MPFFAALALSASIAAPLPIRLEGKLVHPRRLMVKADADADLTGYRVLARYPQIGWAVVEPQTGVSPQSLKTLSGRHGVEQATYDRAALPAYTPNDPGWPQQWHLRTIKADLAWDQSLGSDKAIVAIMDTGVDVTHPDLAANVWVNPGEIPGNGIDDDGDGYIDDVNGYDFAYNDPSPNDVIGHGTGCAGIAAAVGDNNLQLSGVAPRAKVMALKAALDSGFFYDSANVPAYIYAADHGAKVLSMSFYSDRVSPSEEDALKYALNKGTLPVAAAANESTVLPFYPAAYEGVLSVAAINQDLSIAGFSDFGSWVDVAAPGTGLVTLAAGGGTMGFSGTSGACPHVAGAAALLAGAVPKAGPTQLRNVLEDTAQSLTQAPFGEYTNYGLIDVQKAMTQLRSGGAAPARSTLVRWVSPVGPGNGTVATRVYGRSLHVGNLKGKSPVGDMTLKGARQRDRADFILPTGTDTFRIEHEGQTIAKIVSPRSTIVYPFIEGVGGRNGSVLTGGFYDTLKPDSARMKVTAANGQIAMQGTFRMVPKKKSTRPALLELRAKYSSKWKGTQHVYLYDWSSASYPYGNLREFTQLPVHGDLTEVGFSFNDWDKYVDDTGTVYFFLVADNAPAGSSISIDTLYILPPQ